MGAEPFVPLEPPLLELSEDLKLALDRLLRSLKEKGAIIDCA